MAASYPFTAEGMRQYDTLLASTVTDEPGLIAEIRRAIDNRPSKLVPSVRIPASSLDKYGGADVVINWLRKPCHGFRAKRTDVLDEADGASWRYVDIEWGQSPVSYTSGWCEKD